MPSRTLALGATALAVMLLAGCGPSAAEKQAEADRKATEHFLSGTVPPYSARLKPIERPKDH